MAIRITRVYTRTGDDGTTGLVGGERVAKDSPRVEAYGVIDELNSFIGLARAFNEDAKPGAARDRLEDVLRRLQNELFDLGSELATPPEAQYEGMFRVGADDVAALERVMDECQKDLEPLKSFVLPGGGRLSACLHVARTVCRRAERDILRLSRTEDVGQYPLTYVNRLSDLLFVLARWAAKKQGASEYLWERGLRNQRPSESGPREEEVNTMGSLYLKQLPLGPMQNFVYLVGDRDAHRAVVVDPAWDIDAIIDTLAADDMKLDAALITHFHPDHLGGNLMGHKIPGAVELLERGEKIKIWVHKSEADYVPRVCGLSPGDLSLAESGDEVVVGEQRVRFLHTPGHTPGSQCFLVGNNLVSGDTLFIGGCGRVDLPGSDPAQMYDSLVNKLKALPDDTVLYPGHDYADRPSSTIADEKRRNPYLRFERLEDFLGVMGY